MRRGRPPLEGRPMDVKIHVRVTPEQADAIDTKRGKQTRAGWVRDQIKRGLGNA